MQKRLVKNGCNPNDIGYSKMVSLLVEGIGDFLMEFPSIKSIFCGIAGISTGDYAKRLSDELQKRYPHVTVRVKNDSFNLFALEKNADMAVISGTGSVVFVKNGDSYNRIGGWGYLLDNAGSAYDIGRDALRQGLYEEDRKESPSLISELLRQKLATDTVWNHINTVYNEGKPYIASLASVVFDAYQGGDEQARSIIDKNAKALAELLNAGVRLYGATPIAIAAGGVFEHYGDIMIPYIEKYSNVKIAVKTIPPICGACINACEMIVGERSREFYENFKKSYGGVK